VENEKPDHSCCIVWQQEGIQHSQKQKGKEIAPWFTAVVYSFSQMTLDFL